MRLGVARQHVYVTMFGERLRVPRDRREEGRRRMKQLRTAQMKWTKKQWQAAVERLRLEPQWGVSKHGGWRPRDGATEAIPQTLLRSKLDGLVGWGEEAQKPQADSAARFEGIQQADHLVIRNPSANSPC